MYGDFSPDRRIPIASASKLVAGLTILRLVDQGRLSLKSTTGQVLGWKGPQAAITLEQLLSFTSGLPPRDVCTLRPEITLAECVSSLSKLKLAAAPGTRFDYGNTHLHVAARMAEVVTGKTWDALFTAQATEPYPDAVIGDTPVARIDLNYHYGLAVWLECPPPAVNCPVQSSPGAFGFTPWVDRTGGYYAILGMDLGGRRTGVVRFSVELAQKLRPLIREALRQ